MANISELKSGQGSVNVEGVIKELGEVKIINKYGRELKLCNAILEDDSGSIKLTLWNDDAARFKEGDKVKIVNGYVSEFQGDLQLTSGKFGRMEKVGGGTTSNEEGTLSEIKSEIDNELTDPVAKGKKASVSKKVLKKKNEESQDEYSEEVSEEKSDDEPIEEELF